MLNIFDKNLHHRLLVGFSIQLFSIPSKLAISKIFYQLSKTFCVFIFIMHFLFCSTNQKNVLQKEIKDRALEVYLLTGEPGSWFLLIELLKITCARSNASRSNILLKLSKITMTCPFLLILNSAKLIAIFLSLGKAKVYGTCSFY